MNRRVPAWAVAVAVLLAGAAGCSDATRIEEEPGVVLTLRTEIRPGPDREQVVAVVEVENGTAADVHYQAGCGFLVGITVEDAGGKVLTTWDPLLRPECPPVLHVLRAGESIVEAWGVGRAWDETGVAYSLPPGRYTVRCGFAYFVDGLAEPVRLARAVDVDLG
jgi:hypothetical protein